MSVIFIRRIRMDKSERMELFESVLKTLDRETELKRHGFLNSEYYEAQAEALKAVQYLHDRNIFKDY